MNKYIKVLAMISFLIGLVLIFCAVGTDDFYVMQLHQEHQLNWQVMVVGCLMCIPLPVVLNKDGKDG